MKDTGFFQELRTSVRLVVATMTVCCVLYGLAVLAFGQTVVPARANGSLILNGRGEPVGSALIAQGFVRPEYFWPRPSAVDYNASSAGGSNLSPTNPELRARAQGILAKMGADSRQPLPADLATASGSGLDPHITLTAAEYQAGRVAATRGVSVETVRKLLKTSALHTGGVLTPEPVVNVLRANLALDKMRP
jgi:K+-transporting ATPase ATPase C chain